MPEPLTGAALFKEMHAKYDHRDYRWTVTTQEQFDESLCCLPPELMAGGAFLMGEPIGPGREHDILFAAFAKIDGVYCAKLMSRSVFWMIFDGNLQEAK